jgi:hypothetical protein
MMTEANVLPYKRAGIARQVWTAPRIQILDIRGAEGANTGPLCDKHGSLSATTGNDRCTSSEK